MMARGFGSTDPLTQLVKRLVVLVNPFSITFLILPKSHVVTLYCLIIFFHFFWPLYNLGKHLRTLLLNMKVKRNTTFEKPIQIGLTL